MEIKNYTTISISRETKKLLEKQGSKGETFDKLIKRIIKEVQNEKH